MAGAGILGADSARSQHPPQKRRSSGRWWELRVRRRERWLVALGVVLHAVFMLSIFDIYFKTPIIHGMDPFPQRFTPPAKRLVLLVGQTLIETLSRFCFLILDSRSCSRSFGISVCLQLMACARTISLSRIRRVPGAVLEERDQREGPMGDLPYPPSHRIKTGACFYHRWLL